MTNQQKQTLNKLSVWKARSFPNGSYYQKQELPEGTHDGVRITMQYNVGYQVDWPDGERTEVAFRWQSVGGGVNLGAHYNTRDQALTDLRP